MNQRTNWLAIIFVTLLGCATPEKSVEPLSAEAFLQRGLAQLKSENVKAAESTLDEMELLYPVNQETAELHINLLRIYHRAKHWEAVEWSASWFISVFPTHPNVDYVYYARGIANFQSSLMFIKGQQGKDANPKPAQQALESFNNLVKCCSTSKYTSLAQRSIKTLKEALAQYELAMMEQEYRRGTNRGWYIINQYGDTKAAKRVLGIMEEDDTGSSNVAKLPKVKAPPPAAKSEPMVKPKLAEKTKPRQKVNKQAAFVIQLASHKNLDSLNRIMNNIGLGNQVSIHRRNIKGNVIYSAVYGSYPNKESTKKDVARLKSMLNGQALWVRKMNLSKPLN